MLANVRYVQPHDDFTNEYLARELPKEDSLREVKCKDNKRRNLWRCNKEFVEKLEKSQQKLRFSVFVKENSGQIRKFVQHRKKAVKLEKASEL